MEVMCWPIRPILDLWGSKVCKKMGDSLPWMQMNRRAKFDAASFILGREIRNRTNTRTNSKRNIHTLPIGMCGYWIVIPDLIKFSCLLCVCC